MASVAPKLILDNRVNVSDSFSQLVYYSGVNVNYFTIQPDGSTFPSQVLYNNIVVPNLSTTLVSRNIRHQYDVAITYDKSSANAPQLAGVDNYGGAAGVAVLGQNPYPIDTALRAPMPLQQVCSTTSLTINSGTNTINSQTVLDPLTRRIRRKHLMNQSSEAPSMLDNQWKLTTDAGAFVGSAPIPVAAAATWAAVVDAGTIDVVINGITVSYTPLAAAEPGPTKGYILALVAPPGYKAVAEVSANFAANTAYNIANVYLYKTPGVAGSVADQPLSAYVNSCGGWTRGSFLPYSISSVGNNVTVIYNVVESVYISPLTLQDKETFLANINTLSLLFNYSNLTTMFESANSGVAITNVAVQSPRLLLQYIQINPEFSSIPRSVSYNLDDIVYFSKVYNKNLATPQLLQSDTVRLQAMPSLVMCLARKPITSLGVGDSNTFLTIGQAAQNAQAGVSINIGNRTGLMASATVQDVFRMAKRNGWQGSYNEFLQAGSCLCFSPVEDLGIDPSLDTLPLQTGSVNLQIQYPVNGANYLQSTGAAYNGDIELIIVVVYAGVASITTDQFMRNLGALSSSEMAATLAKSDQEGAKFSSEHVQPTIQGEGLASSHKYILGNMNAKHRASKLAM